MSVNPKLKAELSDMFESAKEQSGGGVNIPDGTYQFKITDGGRFESAPKPHYIHKAEVVKGADDTVGETVEIRDNMETADNMGWFKSRMSRLNVSGLTFDDIEDGTLAEQLMGKVFEGMVKSKGGFANIYVNRLISEGSAEDKASGKKGGKAEKGEEEEEQKEEKSEAAFAEGDAVTWTSKDGEKKSGEVVEVIEDEGLTRVKKADDSIVRVRTEILKKAAGKKAAKEEEEEEEEEKGGKGEQAGFELPAPEAVDEMSMKEVKDALGELSFEAADVKQPRAVLKAFCTLGHDADAKLEVTEVSPLADALGVTLKKGSTFKEQVALLSKAVQKRIG